MIVNVHIPSGAARIDMPGRFDSTINHKFIKSYTPLLGDASIREIEVELSAVEFLDSSALDMLMLLKKRATVANKSISLLNTSTLISRVLEITDLNGAFNIRHTA
jgi:anti-anti-sigma factor